MKNNKKVKPIKAEKYEEKEEFEELDELIDDKEQKTKKGKPSKKTTTKSAKKTTPKKTKKKKESEELLDEEYDDDLLIDEEEPKKKKNIFMKIFNIIFVIILVSMVFISIDVICVARYQKGPFFAIRTSHYKDGGTKVYYGLGYKVIKYNVIDGRKDTQLGFWNMPYSVTPTKVEDVDMAIEFTKNYEKTIKKYHNQYLQITSTIKEIDKDKNKMTLEYTDTEGGKYTLQFICKMGSAKDVLNEYAQGDKVAVTATVSEFKLKTKDTENRLYLNDCFIEE